MRRLFKFTIERYKKFKIFFILDGTQEFQGDSNAVTGCMPGERACGSNECVKMEYVCDGERDCRDGSDEQVIFILIKTLRKKFKFFYNYFFK